MNERSNERLQQAGTPTASPVAGNALGAETADQRDAAMASGLPAANGFAPATALSTAPAKRYPLWMQAVALILVVTLSLMSWNETTIAEARTMISGDAVPMASAPTGDEGDAEDAADDDQQDEGDGTSRAITEVSDEDLTPFLPEGLVAADGVIPALSEAALQKKADTLDNAASKSEEELAQAFAERMTYSLDASGALQDADGNYHVNGAELSLSRPASATSTVSSTAAIWAAGKTPTALPWSSAPPSYTARPSRASLTPTASRSTSTVRP